MPSRTSTSDRFAVSVADDDVDDLELLAEHDFMTSDSEDEDDDGETAASGSGDEDEDDDVPHEITEEHYDAIRTTVIDIVTALGGIEDVANEQGDIDKVYVIGDDCLRCLRDLRTLLQQDQDDSARVIPTIFSEVNVVQRGLLPLLLKTVDMGERGSKIALACTDLLTSLTWPIDIVAEQQAALNQDNGVSPLQSYLRMQDVFVSYKAAILRLRSSESKGSPRSILASITLHILLPALAKSRHIRTPRDTGTIGMCLYLFRNLLAIRDPVATSLSGHEAIALSNLQNDLLIEFQAAHVLDTILMLASNAESSDFEAWNIVTAECVYYIYAGARPEHLLEDSRTKESPASSVPLRSNSALLDALAAESRQKSHEILSAGTSRHSRYSTTISFKDADGALRVARSQRSLRKTPDELLVLCKEKKRKRRFQRRKTIDEIGAARARTTWTPAAAKVASSWAQQFLSMGFESLVRSVLKDIRSESFKAGNIEQTRTRIMRLSHIFLEYFLLAKAADEVKVSQSATESRSDAIADADSGESSFDVVGYWLEPWALKMAWMRASSARDDKKWLEFVTAVQLWTTLLRLLEALSRSASQADRDRAEGIQAMHFYNELTLDAAKSVTKTYTNQSFRCLETVLDFAHIMPRLLERYSKDKENLYVKLKRQTRQKKDAREEQALNEREEQEQVQLMVESQIKERRFEFEKFQSHLCSHALVDACFTYLQRWQEAVESTEEHMCGVVHILHRLAIKAGGLRLFFPYERRMAMRKIQNNHSFWIFLQSRSTRVSDDMSKLLKYMLSKFDKLDAEEKAKWSEGMKVPKPVKAFKMPPEIEIIKSEGRHADRLVAVGMLYEVKMVDFVIWLSTELEEALRVRQAIYEEEKAKTSSTEENFSAEDDETIATNAAARFTDYVLSYHDNNRVREDASTRPEAKLLCRLMDLKSIEDDDRHWKWIVSSTKNMSSLRDDVEWLQGDIARVSDNGPPEVPYSSKVKRKSQASKKRHVVINEFGDEEEVRVPRARGIRSNARANAWLDTDLIEDSDEEIEQAGRLLALQRRERGSAEGDASPAPIPARLPSSNGSLSPIRNATEWSDDNSSPSSVTSNVSASPSSVPMPLGPNTSEHRNRLSQKRRAILQSREALFRGPDSESGDEDEDDDVHNGEGHPAFTPAESKQVRHNGGDDVLQVSFPLVRKRKLKRHLHDEASRSSDGTDADDESEDGHYGNDGAISSQSQARKRRACIIDDDDDDE